MKKRPIQIQSEFFEKVWTNADIDAVFDYFDGKAGGLGAGEPLDPVGYIDFYHALSSVVKDVEFELPRWFEQDDRLYVEFVMKARARKRDKAIFWHGAATGFYRDGKIAGEENFLDFMDLFRQLELVPEQVVELGLAGEEILQVQQAAESLGPEFRRLFWPGYGTAGPASDLLLPENKPDAHLPSAEQVEVLFRSATFATLTTDLDDRIVDRNARFDELVGCEQRRFSDLIVGKGKEAEKRAREALIQGAIPNYRIRLSLQGKGGLVRVWISAVIFEREGLPARILRSVERDELIDDLVSMQENDRKLLSQDLTREVLEPVLQLWGKFSTRATNDPAVRVECLEKVSHLAEQLRKRIRSLRNPILEGVPLSQAWPELNLDPTLDQADETVALLTYRLVNEGVSFLQADLQDLSLFSEAQWIRGSLPIRPEEGSERVKLLKNLCDLVGGRMSVSTGDEKTKLNFWLPFRRVG